jgi:competence ComEA-like helix-hairpin-helix protein
MRGWEQFAKDYLSFTKKERIGIICILIILTLIYFLPSFFPATPSSLSISEALAGRTDTAIIKRIVDDADLHDDVLYPYEASLPTTPLGELFNFDPNTLSPEGWKRLGLNDRVIKTINNYRTKGGKFYKKEDLQKIWGIPKGFYERVQPYIQIPPKEKQYSGRAYSYPVTIKRNLSFEINNADTSAFIALPGIGSKLASRIINFREKLGGFYSTDQVSETYGLPDSTFQKIKSYLQIDHSMVKKININTATKDELKMHPYIKWNLANTIVEYRNQHGPYQTIEGIKELVNVDEKLYQKLKFYLVVE